MKAQPTTSVAVTTTAHPLASTGNIREIGRVFLHVGLKIYFTQPIDVCVQATPKNTTLRSC